jgi:ketosteroid isomerase-like protein
MSPEKSSTAQKIDRMRDAYRGFERGALEIFMNIIRDDAVWHSQLAGSDYTGKAAIRGALERLLAATDEYRVDIHDIVANEEHMIVLEVHNARFKNGEVLKDSLSTAVYHLDDEGLVTEVWPLLDTALWKKALGM